MTQEGFKPMEAELGRGKSPESRTVFDSDNIDEIRNAFLSGSEHKAGDFSTLVARTLIAHDAVHIVIQYINKFPEDDRSTIMAELSETEAGKKALGLE